MSTNWYDKTLGSRLAKLYSLRSSCKNEELSKIDETISVIESLVYSQNPSTSLNDFTYSYRSEKERFMCNADFIEMLNPYFLRDCIIPRSINGGSVKLSEQEKLELTKDFFGTVLDDELYKKFKTIYKNRDKNIFFGSYGFEDCEGEAFYLPYFNEVFLRIRKGSTIANLEDLAHEFGHGIQFLINYNPALFDENIVFSEIVSIFFQMLSLNYYKGIKVLSKVASNEERALYNIRLMRVKQLFLLLNMFKEWEELENLGKRKMQKEINSDLKFFESYFSYDRVFDIESILKLNLSNRIPYVFSTAIAVELFMVYVHDKKRGLELLKRIIMLDLSVPKDEYMSEISRMGIQIGESADDYEKVLQMKSSINF